MLIPAFLVPVEAHLALSQLVVAVFGLVATICGGGLALAQFRRNEVWRRGEFIAKELKDFNSNPAVFLGLTLIDWGQRRVNLHADPNLERDKYVKVTRDLQWHALVPHDVKEKHRLDSGSGGLDHSRRFTNDEARIRDLYDIVLRYFERYAHLAEARLVEPRELAPYLHYWLKAIGGTDFEPDDYEWRCALITFIWRYGYTGVAQLCAHCGFALDADSPAWQCIAEHLAGTELLTDCAPFVPNREQAKKRIADMAGVRRWWFPLPRLRTQKEGLALSLPAASGRPESRS